MTLCTLMCTLSVFYRLYFYVYSLYVLKNCAFLCTLSVFCILMCNLKKTTFRIHFELTKSKYFLLDKILNCKKLGKMFGCDLKVKRRFSAISTWFPSLCPGRRRAPGPTSRPGWPLTSSGQPTCSTRSLQLEYYMRLCPTKFWIHQHNFRSCIAPSLGRMRNCAAH